MAKAGDSGLTFICRLMGRRVRQKAVHVKHLKPFEVRSDRLSSPDAEPNVRVTTDQVRDPPHDKWLERIVDRSSVGASFPFLHFVRRLVGP